MIHTYDEPVQLPLFHPSQQLKCIVTECTYHQGRIVGSAEVATNPRARTQILECTTHCARKHMLACTQPHSKIAPLIEDERQARVVNVVMVDSKARADSKSTRFFSLLHSSYLRPSRMRKCSDTARSHSHTHTRHQKCGKRFLLQRRRTRDGLWFCGSERRRGYRDWHSGFYMPNDPQLQGASDHLPT